MKYFLIPSTMFLWYLTTYYGLYLAVIGIFYMFSLSWLWLIMFYTFLIGTISGISIGIPSLLRFFILKFYGITWFICIVHSIAGLVGVIRIIRFFNVNPPEVVIGNESPFFLIAMWQVAPVKTVFLAFLFAGLVISLSWSTIIAPIYIKLSEEQIGNDK